MGWPVCGRRRVRAALIAAVLAGGPRASSGMSVEKAKMKPNHLIEEKSPYLLQHAYNPVDWYPWGEEAFEKARREKKPILLSIGYSTCHWCHVMERESFSDPGIASIMNRHFVSIKLDREERPDIDRIYMSAVQAMTGQGGWPLNVFLTPELKPFFGGTYFPPQPRWGQPGFPQLLERIAELWKTRREELERDSRRLTEAIKSFAGAEGRRTALDTAWLDKAYASYGGSFDPSQGGFGGAPKFPMPVHQNFLLRYHARAGAQQAREMVLATLRSMARGGIYDQLGGGFHRYSTDAEWFLPHFEKMLYDNSQLAVNFLEAYQASRDPEFSRVARETLGYLLRDMRDPEGGFYSAEDADSLSPELAAKGEAGQGHENKAEGAFYLWTEAELRARLGKDAGLFAYRYGVRSDGNIPSDPHGEFKGKNLLHARHTVPETASKFGRKADEVERILESAKSRLLDLRAKRPRPGLDDKILTSWNGLTLSALAKGYQALGEPRYLDAAQKAARFIRSNLYDSRMKRLYHRWRKGERAIHGIANDYAFLVQGLIDLYEASFETEWLEWAVELSEEHNRLFLGPEGGYYMTAEGHDKNLLARVMEDSDNVEPSASSVAALNLLRLSQFTHREDFRKTAEKTLEYFGSRMGERPLSLPQMLSALDYARAKPKQIIIAGPRDWAGTRDFIKELNSRFIPAKIVMVLDDKSRPVLAGHLPFLKGVVPIAGRPTAYVCVDYACELPTNELAVFKRILDGKPAKK